ncbi:MAG TPA: sigma-70 family RNA polymerase sigma factor [Acidimicrobiales bacterium]|nr:sigma-70 family RNA polymerase sigma factor [Acidimicrobiales bacterium]
MKAPGPGQQGHQGSESRPDTDGTPEPGDTPARGNGQSQDQAFKTYVVPELDVMFRVAMSLTRNRADAEDLVQDTLIRAYRAIERFDGRHPRAWLLTILRNAQINRTRRRRPELLHDPDTEMDRLATTTAGDEHDPEAVVVDPVFDATVKAALEALPVKFRRPVELVDLGGLSYQEAADQIQVPVGTVMSRLHRARKRMRAHLEKAGYGLRELD